MLAAKPSGLRKVGVLVVVVVVVGELGLIDYKVKFWGMLTFFLLRISFGVGPSLPVLIFLWSGIR